CEPAGIEKPACALIQRNMQCNDIGPPQELVKIDRFDPVGCIKVAKIENVVCQYRTVERLQQRHEILADMPAPDDPDGPSRQVTAHVLSPDAGKDLTMRRRYVPEHGDGTRDYQLSHRPSVDSSGPTQPLAVFAHGGQVDHIKTHTVLRDHP